MTRRMITALTCLLGLMSACATAFEPPQEEPDEFHFVVLGDAQFHKPAQFNRIIDQARRLHPAFAIQVGDLIEGYNSDMEEVEAEWERFAHQIGPLDPIPFIAIAGNHDVYNGERKVDTAMERLFEHRWGPLYFTFSYKNAQFIGLNTDSTEAVNDIAGRQLQWLKQTLSKPGPQHRFVFMHRPPLMTRNADDLHALFVRHGISHVFYGHHHHYHHFQQDGVTYVMTNAAANSVNDQEQIGGMPHLLQVSVRGETVALAPIKADAVLPADAVHPLDNYDYFALNQKLAPARVDLQASGENAFEFSLPLHNASQRDITVYTSCTSDDQRWTFDPAVLPPVALEAGAEQVVQIKVGYTPERVPESEPVCALRVPFQTHTGAWLDFNAEVRGTAR